MFDVSSRLSVHQALWRQEEQERPTEITLFSICPVNLIFNVNTFLTMVNCGNLLKTVLVIMVVVGVVESATGAEKLASCCEKVSSQEITEPITGYLVQKASFSCVRAVIFQTKTGLFCSQVNAPWVRRKIIAFEKAKALNTPSSVAPSSTMSLLSIITSTASPPSSSLPYSSSSSLPSSSLPPSSSSLPSSSLPPFFSSVPSSSLPPSSSSLPSSSLPPFISSSPEMPADETFSESKNE